VFFLNEFVRNSFIEECEANLFRRCVEFVDDMSGYRKARECRQICGKNCVFLNQKKTYMFCVHNVPILMFLFLHCSRTWILCIYAIKLFLKWSNFVNYKWYGTRCILSLIISFRVITKSFREMKIYMAKELCISTISYSSLPWILSMHCKSVKNLNV